MKLHGEILYTHRLDTQTLRIVHAEGIVDVFFENEDDSAIERLYNHCPEADKWFAILPPSMAETEDTARVYIIYDAPNAPDRYIVCGDFERTLPLGVVSGHEATRSKVLTDKERFKVIATIEAVAEYDPDYTKFVQSKYVTTRTARFAQNIAPF